MDRYNEGSSKGSLYLLDAGGVLLHPHRGRASALHRVHATPLRVILSKAKDLKSASWCIQILHFVQNDNKKAIKEQ